MRMYISNIYDLYIMNSVQTFHNGIEKQDNFFKTLASLVKPKTKRQTKPQVSYKNKSLGVFLPMKTQGCFILVRSKYV